MLYGIDIQNFKSVEKLKLEFGRLNIFIGENGCGKSSILEAITFVAAAEANKLDTEFLENRGIRVSTPQLMRSNFSKSNSDTPIELKVYIDAQGAGRTYIINNENETYSEWKLETDTIIDSNEESFSQSELARHYEQFNMISKLLNDTKFNKLKELFKDEDFEKQLDEFKAGDFGKKFEEITDVFGSIESDVNKQLSPLKNFVIYSPQNKQLRNLKEEGSIRPIGIHGEGLFKLLRELYVKQPESFEDLEKGLKLMGWYKSMDLDNEPELAEDELYIQDKFLPVAITQRSANEGFLYVLFYMALIISKDTPKIFAIDNIDAALNPKLCTKITSYLSELAKKYDKQLFLTTHNPATLDGINLSSKEEKLFIVSRKKKGQTTAKEFTLKQMPKINDELMLLSEAMIKGFIGGLPRGF